MKMSFLSFQIKAGWMLNIFGIVVITFYINTYGKALLNLDTFPSWAELPGARNTTSLKVTQTTTAP